MIEQPTDILDQATERTQQELDSLLEAHKQRRESSIKPKGICYFCDEKVDTDKLFCDEYCAEDYEYFEERKKANGR